jgi:hypothetical protein
MEKEMTFEQLKDAILKFKSKSEYKQAAIVILRLIYEQGGAEKNSALCPCSTAGSGVDGVGLKDGVGVLPCRCGAMPTINPKDPEIEGGAWGEVRCENPECPARPRILDGEDTADDRGSDEYKRIAIIRWNKFMAGSL